MNSIAVGLTTESSSSGVGSSRLRRMQQHQLKLVIYSRLHLQAREGLLKRNWLRYIVYTSSSSNSLSIDKLGRLSELRPRSPHIEQFCPPVKPNYRVQPSIAEPGAINCELVTRLGCELRILAILPSMPISSPCVTARFRVKRLKFWE